MNKEIKVLTLEECVDTIKQMIRNSTLIPVIGSGFSAGNKSNNGYVPSGKQMKGDMLKALFEAGYTIDSNKKTFSQIAKYYNRLITASIRKEYVANNFIGVIRFDNINLLFGGARGSYKPSGVKKLIQNIYSNLKELLGEDYQFNHQHAKCLLWGIEEVQEPNRGQYLTEALNAAYLSAQLIDEALANNPKNNFLKISEAHVQFTISI